MNLILWLPLFGALWVLHVCYRWDPRRACVLPAMRFALLLGALADALILSAVWGALMFL